MNNALIISGLTKTYKDFVLDNVSFSVPSGSIVGLQYPCNYRQLDRFRFWIIFSAGNKRTSDFGPGSFHNSGFYQYHKRRGLKME